MDTIPLLQSAASPALDSFMLLVTGLVVAPALFSSLRRERVVT